MFRQLFGEIGPFKSTHVEHFGLRLERDVSVDAALLSYTQLLAKLS